MGMIRVSDEVESRLKAISDGRSMSGTVEMLLTSVGPDGKIHTEPALCEETRDFLNKRFDELKSLITDNLVDVVAAGDHANRSYPQDNDILDWDVFRYIVFDLCKDDSSPEWVSQSVHDAMDNLNDPITTIILDGYIWAVNDYGKSKLLKVSPRIEEAIREGRCYE